MPVLKNPKHEAFAQARAKGKTIDAAYKVAGYKPNRGNAARMNANESIQARVAELQGRAAKRTEKTVADIVRQLDDDRDLAYRNKSASAAVAASMAQAKVLGLILDKAVNVTKSVDDMTEDELRRFLGKV